MEKEVFIIAGANGSGKTTLAKEFLIEYGDYFTTGKNDLFWLLLGKMIMIK